MIIGIIGKVGSGKSACIKYLKKNFNAHIFSCDDIAKEMIENGEVNYKIENAYEFFKSEKLQNECREKVHKNVFLKIIENICILENISGYNEINYNSLNINNFCEQMKIKTTKLYAIESALPSEMIYNICDKVICIENSYEKKLELLKSHRNYTDNQVKLIYDSQKYYEKYYDMADYKIKNDMSIDDLINKFKEVVDEICVICKQ